MGNGLEGQNIKHVYPGGAVYQGDFKENQREGKGVYTSKEGHRYEGGWLADMRHGYGSQKFVARGSTRKEAKWTGTYEGNWFENRKHGKGVFTYENGDKYEGDWRNGKKAGHGIYTYGNGDRYEGAFKSNNMHGKGTMFFADGSRLDGIWNDDELHGYASLVKPNGEQWQQVYQNDDVISSTRLKDADKVEDAEKVGHATSDHAKQTLKTGEEEESLDDLVAGT
eukprot:gb/GEZN01010561.1/.p1 GENE.gb/GEZN01010561.1/~~gb/GEZN01010561.1/.p1  ORF type:complete len:224 (-),score=46.63 gb/GEZN01010561.1/:394-1065(-)